eukprot:SAG25_NODE_1441_length_3011_cov_1.216003_4_plen_161_part_00
MTPERVAKSKTLISKLQKAYAGGRLRRIVVDEVHCLAVDGQVRACWALRADFQCNVFQLNPPRLQDFRPDYLKLRTLRAVFPETPILGCTGATMLSVLLSPPPPRPPFAHHAAQSGALGIAGRCACLTEITRAWRSHRHRPGAGDRIHHPWTARRRSVCR